MFCFLFSKMIFLVPPLGMPLFGSGLGCNICRRSPKLTKETRRNFLVNPLITVLLYVSANRVPQTERPERSEDKARYPAVARGGPLVQEAPIHVTSEASCSLQSTAPMNETSPNLAEGIKDQAYLWQARWARSTVPVWLSVARTYFGQNGVRIGTSRGETRLPFPQPSFLFSWADHPGERR